MVDAYAEHEDQIDKSPYAYVWDNPIVHDDPDGNCPICEMLIAGAVGAAVDYGEQVATNYATGAAHPWTNVNLTSVATAGGAAFITGGGSILENTGAKVAVKVTAAVINNTVEVNPVTGVKVNSAANVVKNTAIDLAADGVANKIGGKIEAKLSKVGVTNAGKLSSTAKKIVNATGTNVTRATTAAVKNGLQKGTKVAAEASKSTVKVLTNGKKDEIKKNTNTGN